MNRTSVGLRFNSRPTAFSRTASQPSFLPTADSRFAQRLLADDALDGFMSDSAEASGSRSRRAQQPFGGVSQHEYAHTTFARATLPGSMDSQELFEGSRVTSVSSSSDCSSAASTADDDDEQDIEDLIRRAEAAFDDDDGLNAFIRAVRGLAPSTLNNSTSTARASQQSAAPTRHASKPGASRMQATAQANITRPARRVCASGTYSTGFYRSASDRPQNPTACYGRGARNAWLPTQRMSRPRPRSFLREANFSAFPVHQTDFFHSQCGESHTYWNVPPSGITTPTSSSTAYMFSKTYSPSMAPDQGYAVFSQLPSRREQTPEDQIAVMLANAQGEGSEAVRKTFKGLLLKWHPDKCPQGNDPASAATREEAARVLRFILRERERIGT